ncbi:hypothetical protein JCM13591A_38530 [Microbacterium xylanilyticum]
MLADDVSEGVSDARGLDNRTAPRGAHRATSLNGLDVEHRGDPGPENQGRARPRVDNCDMTDAVEAVFRDLAGHELALLAAAAEPFRLSRHLGAPARWPVWDFVARTFAREHGTEHSPEEMLASLPIGRAIDDRGPYRLYWLLDVTQDGVPNDGSTFGLTIAGLHAVRAHNPQLGEMADQLATFYGALAREAGQIPATPYEAASWQAPLMDFTVGVRSPGSVLPLTLGAGSIAAILNNESEPVRSVESADGYRCDLRGRRLRPFLGVTTAPEYLAVAWRDGDRAVGDVSPSPLTLIQTIDYLGYVLEATDHWKASGHPEHLIQIRSLSAAAALGQDAATGADFDNRISSLWTIIDHLSLPAVPLETANRQFGGANGSVARLEYALGQIVTESPYTDQVRAALGVIRDVRDLRVAAQHDTDATRARGARARSHFGLTPIPVSWGGDWDTVRGLVARALSDIIDAVQAEN